MMANESADWQPIELVLLLFVLAVGSDMLTVEIRSIRISGAFLALVLAMALLGPAPAAAIGGVSALIDGLVSRRPWDRALNNVVTWATFPAVGGILIDVMVGTGAPAHGDALAFAAIVLLIFMVTNLLNLAMVAAFHRAAFGTSMRATFES